MSRAFGRYRVVRPLGEGATAEVFEVEDPVLGVRRALKVLHPEVARQEELRVRFEAEARTLARLRHAHLLAVHDVGETEGRSWMVMDLAEGGSLADRVAREGAMAPEEVLSELLGVLDALSVVHAAGVIHRDIKPPNLLYDGEGKLRLADFGIALTSGVDLTRTGMVLGSWGFMAPEQRLDPRKVRPATDLFGVAASAVWAIVGGPVSDLHVGEHRATLLRDVSPDVSGVLHRALAFRPEERFRSAGEMGVAVEGVVGEGSHLAPTRQLPVDPAATKQVAPTMSRPATSMRPPQPRWGWVAGLLVLAGLAGGGLALQDSVRERIIHESESVRQARELAAIPNCPDTPTRWERRASPRWSTSVPGGREAGGGVAADIDGDGHKDLLFVHALEEEFRVYWGTGSDFDDTPTRVPARRMSWGMPRVADVGDFDGDGDLDLVGVAVEDRGFVIVHNHGGRRFGQASVVDTGEVPAGVRVVDWDADGLQDLLFTTLGDGVRRLRWRRAQKGGTFDTTLDLTGELDAFDVEADTQNRPSAVQYLYHGALFRASRRSDGRLAKAEHVVDIPLGSVDALRVMANGKAHLWNTTQRTKTAITVTTSTNPHRSTQCVWELPGAADANNIVDFDGDSIEDVISVATCAYCSSSYQLFLGAR